MNEIILEGKNLTKIYSNAFGQKKYSPVKDFNIRLYRGQSLGLMGPSGCGKSTVARMLICLLKAEKGKVFFNGEEVTGVKSQKQLEFRDKVQMISQRPEGFFDPSYKLKDSVLEPMKVRKRLEHAKERLPKLLTDLKLNELLLNRYPHQVSGGEIQRLSILRALLLEPEVIILDEPTSMLDISVQAQILQLLKQVKEKYGLSYLLITHDVDVANFMCDHIIRM